MSSSIVEVQTSASVQPPSNSSSPSTKLPHNTTTDVNKSETLPSAPIHWGNTITFLGGHIIGIYGALFISPITTTPKATLILTLVLYYFVGTSIGIGYHRLYSHRSFEATKPLKIFIALVSPMGWQRSILWWSVSVRHRLHHRFTDDLINDPYSAARGLYFSHVGWLFRRPFYPRMSSIDISDLMNDPVVTFQHRHYQKLALVNGLFIPPLIAWTWGDALGGFIWGSMVCKIMLWHGVFFVNSLAHWKGFRRYSDEVSARANLFVSITAGGEGNHNYVSQQFYASSPSHAFPQDFRNGRDWHDWDPSKWAIFFLYKVGLVKSLKRAPDEDVEFAMDYMRRKKGGVHHNGEPYSVDKQEKEFGEWTGPVWSRIKAEEHVKQARGKCFVFVNDYLVDVTVFMKEHVGGAKILRTYSIRGEGEDFNFQDVTWAFQSFNNHTRIARKRMRDLAVAKVLSV
ncbi:hypothetical protein BU17DRAFT_39677 [Hysterangium stoloniferum]|nr:hypothetical protein BU17DRAFT_39677 [Hysterangium stoloniferum]